MAIVNLVKGKALTIQDKLAESQFEFYLTGSRFFGTATEKSDTDYFTWANFEGKSFPPENDVVLFLKSLGFVEESTSYSGDDFIVKVYVHREANIHVQLYKYDDFKCKIAAQNAIVNSGTVSKNRKSMQNAWQLAMHAAKEMQEMWRRDS